MGSGKSPCYAGLPTVFNILTPFQQPDFNDNNYCCKSFLMKLSKGCVCQPIRFRSEAAVMAGDFQLMYMSPEIVLTDLEWRDLLQSPFFQ